jgi:hypothetical protein
MMGLDFPLMPKSTFAPAIADIGRYPAFNDADRQSLSCGTAGRLFPASTRASNGGSSDRAIARAL